MFDAQLKLDVWTWDQCCVHYIYHKHCYIWRPRWDIQAYTWWHRQPSRKLDRHSGNAVTVRELPILEKSLEHLGIYVYCVLCICVLDFIISLCARNHLWCCPCSILCLNVSHVTIVCIDLPIGECLNGTTFFHCLYMSFTMLTIFFVVKSYSVKYVV